MLVLRSMESSSIVRIAALDRGDPGSNPTNSLAGGKHSKNALK